MSELSTYGSSNEFLLQKNICSSVVTVPAE